MPDIATDWPRKTRELSNHHMESTHWDDFAFRDDDVIIGTYAKSGTTWTQQIVGQLIHQGDPNIAMAELSPWWDMRIIPPDVREMIRGYPGRRVLKTHLPADALVLSPEAKYLYVGRDGRDVAWSLHNHHLNHSDLVFQMLNDTPGRVGPPLPKADPDVRRYFNFWLETDGGHHWSFSENIRTWWDIRHLSNVKLIHFANLKADMEGEIRKIADFLEIDVPAAKWPRIVEHCTFDWMKANGEKIVPLGGAGWNGGADTFLHKGTNGRWKDVISAAESARFEELMRERLGRDCAHWLATGEGA
ncbi:sulfotransferase domain-containing protein [uncultured Phenylobacterium sp.]|uniref:sulfotransferase domain-containing protein n=1 Tax=uncultured Phenylobacterium sp. TaxID=349273 RepID=UPI0025FE95E6|nr:sulfotransferase domain-containing protein [uncultured Phenylobacterium sp.]